MITMRVPTRRTQEELVWWVVEGRRLIVEAWGRGQQCCRWPVAALQKRAGAGRPRVANWGRKRRWQGRKEDRAGFAKKSYARDRRVGIWTSGATCESSFLLDQRNYTVKKRAQDVKLRNESRATRLLVPICFGRERRTLNFLYFCTK
jgi:hypothetical protein